MRVVPQAGGDGECGQLFAPVLHGVSAPVLHLQDRRDVERELSAVGVRGGSGGGGRGVLGAA